MEYVARAPASPLESIVDDLYYLAGTPPYPRLTISPMPSALMIINLAAPFRSRRSGAPSPRSWPTSSTAPAPPAPCCTSSKPPLHRGPDRGGRRQRHTSRRAVQAPGRDHPKRLARTYRFAAVVGSIDPAGDVDWAEIAHRAGYHDQPHFNHELRQFTGHTPTSYLDLRRRFAAEQGDHADDRVDRGW
jgi:AraC-like DNA-binding protein